MNLRKLISAALAVATMTGAMIAPVSNKTSSLFATSVITASAATKSTLAAEKSKFPQGKYWNHVGGKANSPETITSTPCNHNNHYHGTYDGRCGCNSFKSSIQCMGFARKIGYDIYGSDPHSWRSTTTYSDVKAGDVVRWHNYHSFMIIKVSGNTLTLGECNWDGKCGIDWTRTVSKSYLSNSVIYHAPSTLPVGPVDKEKSTEPTPAYNTVWVENDIYIFNKTTTLYSDKSCTKAVKTLKSGDKKTFVRFFKANGLKDTIGKTSDGYYAYVRKGEALNVNAYVYVNCDELNVRSGPGVSYSRKTSIYRNKKVRVTKYTGSWAYSSDLGGWISLNYVRG